MPQVECGTPGHAGLLIQRGPTVKVQIGFDAGYRPGPGRDVHPDLPAIEYDALIDTGASMSCIDSRVAAQLGLPSIDQRPVSGAHGAGAVNVHLAQLHIPALGFTQYGEFFGVHLHAGGQGHSALLGRTILKNMSLTYHGANASVLLSFPP